MLHYFLINIKTLFRNTYSLLSRRNYYEASSHSFLNIRKKGSITIEAAGVCSISLLVLGTVLNFYAVLNQEYLLKQAMYRTRETATVLSVVDEEMFSPVLVAYSYLSGKEKGLTHALFYLEQDAEEVVYSGSVTVPFLGLFKGITIGNEMRIHGFSGYSAPEEGGEYVYVTEYGTVYHTNLMCSYLDLDIASIASENVEDYRNESGAIYYPCENCGDTSDHGLCYITPYGTRFHGDRECSSLIRKVKKVLRDDVDGMEICNKCGNG